jgi:uncharacterized membrane protein
MDNEKSKQEWKSCCFKMNKDFVMFISHFGFLVLLLLITACGIFIDKVNSNVWINLLCLVVGAILPSPQYKRSGDSKKNNNE